MVERAVAELPPDSASSLQLAALPVTVVAERAFERGLLVDFLRRHGFPQAAGRATFLRSAHAMSHDVRGLVFVDLESDKEDARQLLRELHAHTSVSTVAIGTPIQLAALGQDADGWLEVSEPPARLGELAACLVRVGRASRRRRASPAAERWLRTWRSLSQRQLQVLALLGCGLDNHKLAGALGVSERAIKAHVSALLDKFKADSRTELALIASQANLHASPAGVRWRD